MTNNVCRLGFQQPFDSSSGAMDNLSGKPSMSRQIFSQLEQIGKEEGKRYQLIDEGSSIEVYALGDQKARIHKQLSGGSVGDSNGTLKGYYELWEYQKYPWWQKIISKLSNDVLSPLPVPLYRAASDAGVENPLNVLRPEQVIKHYQLINSAYGQSSLEYLREEYWVKQQIVQSMQSLKPHYEVRDYFGLLRLIPLSMEAKRDDLQEGGAYSNSLGLIKEACTRLDGIFKNRLLA